jgi:hypothetical protein
MIPEDLDPVYLSVLHEGQLNIHFEFDQGTPLTGPLSSPFSKDPPGSVPLAIPVLSESWLTILVALMVIGGVWLILRR